MVVLKPKEEYDNLEIPPREEIPYVVGRTNLRVDYLYSMYRSRGLSIKQIARSKRLPKKTIQEAINWCERNSGIVKKVWEEEKSEAGLD